ncbi:hypothetical protein M9H77_08048 [Catharanthus roseus]|uniref:Uncharacterized protein n=1 Tax=Catharanthus roseus TaxID=4058 RepID=A0ACC0BX31_CATRO|nr:hypothetical protein M9H77_08048 [Catharanthus roseus]
MGAQPMTTWSLMKQSLRDRFGVRNHKEQRQGVAKGKIMESSMGEKCTKANKLSQSQDLLDRKSIVSTKESEGKIKENEYLIENHESLKEEQVKEKQDQIEKCEETKEEMSLKIFDGEKREEMKESCCVTTSSLNSLSTEEVNLFTNSNNNFPACVSPSYVMSFQGYEGAANMVQVLKDWFIPKREFEEKSFHGFTIVTKKIPRFTWETCSRHLEFAHKPTILYSSFEVDYFLRFGEGQKLEHLKYIHFKNHDALATNNKKFGRRRLVFGPRGLGWGFLGFG